jgi:hypothetical protein
MVLLIDSIFVDYILQPSLLDFEFIPLYFYVSRHNVLIRIDLLHMFLDSNNTRLRIKYLL